MTVIFPDMNVSPNYFKSAAPEKLLVRTIFYTIQGEGPFAGRPAVFVRLGGCNLGAKGVQAAGCEWCDTDFRLVESQWMSFQDIEAAATYLLPIGTVGKALYVVTGGEPMLQPNLAKFTIWTGWDIQIESNGMYYQNIADKVTLVISPKLGKRKTYPELDGVVFHRANALKFVLDSDPASPYHVIPGYAYDFLNLGKPVYVSPIAHYRRPMSREEGERASIWDHTLIDVRRTRKNYRYAGMFARDRGLLLSLQTHLFVDLP